ncbi:tRNA uridine-5-carboxymethylaminomethyl(34) synthesis GTPase MnmE [Candidatus Acetothermia bacterium]|nr:MAG: tRNA uridine-5-carboxymethylaminomethyl(34) synthesis GTPase MnmE [Candidatus Acetothermia bacterium]
MIGDTIAALSTPVGEGGIGIVRLSGPRSVPIVDRLFRPADAVALPDVPTHTIRYGHIVSDGRTLDEVLVAVMRAPRSYTREDVVEIDCHGGIVATRAILDAVLGAGARLAEPGEFTRRAFLNGRISLDQAQAVLDVVRAKTRLGLEAAIDRLDGRFSSEIGEIRAGIAGLLADLEVGIDFPDFDVDPLRILDPLERIEERVSDLLRLAEDGMRVREGLTVAIAGRPNVGKSTLLNALLAERRAIVTPIPGTTRDTVEGETAIDGVPVRLIDTAGLRDPADPVEAEGVLRAREAVRRSDLLLLVLDRNEPLTDQDRSLLAEEWGIPVLVVLNKTDLPSRIDRLPEGGWEGSIAVSAERGDGIDRLRGLIAELLLDGRVPARNTILLLDTWERDLLRRLGDALSRGIRAIREGSSTDMVAEELRNAYRTSGELQGIDVSESILDSVFSRFCVGK